MGINTIHGSPEALFTLISIDEERPAGNFYRGRHLLHWHFDRALLGT
jgi:hypothetical protein